MTGTEPLAVLLPRAGFRYLAHCRRAWLRTKAGTADPTLLETWRFIFGRAMMHELTERDDLMAPEDVAALLIHRVLDFGPLPARELRH